MKTTHSEKQLQDIRLSPLPNRSTFDTIPESVSFDNLPQFVFNLQKEVKEANNMLRLLLEQKAQLDTTPQDQLFTINEAADFLNLSVPTLYSKVSRGELPHMKRSKRLYFSRLELLDYLKEGRRASNADIDTKAEEYLKQQKLRRG